MNTNNLKNLKQFQDHFQKPLLGTLSLVVLATAGYTGMKYRAVTLAEKYESKGFGALAVDTLEPYRHGLTSTDRGCRTIINAYFLARKPELLEWSAQACINSGSELVEAYIGYASAYEMTGRDPEALRILGSVIDKFQKIPDVYYRIAQILQRNKKEEEAIKAYVKAASITPDDAVVSLEILQNLAALQSWKDAKPIADRLKPLKTTNPAIKLLLARTMIRNGDQAAAKEMTDQAKELITKTPELKPDLERLYADVLNPAPAPAK
ncbi:MAG: tetratricopeptide repeat protein [Bdellovibrionia bacterium]